jgi:hypothetical protein
MVLNSYLGKSVLWTYERLENELQDLQDVQKVRSARPQRAKGRGVRGRYVEALSDARTKLANFFNILLIKVVTFCCQAGIPHGVDGREAMQCAGMVGRTLRSRTEGKG